ncbi:MAG: hypothetical protein ACRDYZ_03360, partial [Acidimicrobiales bacterium]
LRVVAEGVEDLRELELLARMRVDRVQGWLFSKAVPHGEVPSVADFPAAARRRRAWPRRS